VRTILVQTYFTESINTHNISKIQQSVAELPTAIEATARVPIFLSSEDTIIAQHWYGFLHI
jgi:hypothetical protein